MVASLSPVAILLFAMFVAFIVFSCKNSTTEVNESQKKRTVEVKADDMLEGGEKEHSELHGQAAGTKQSHVEIAVSKNNGIEN